MADKHELASALSKLNWAVGGEWSVYLKPPECRALLDALGDRAMRSGTVDHRVRPEEQDASLEAYIGDPGDEHHE